MKDFNNKVAAVTGAASGIGRALAVQLAGHGCHLALCDLDEAGLQETARSAARANPACLITSDRVDVADRRAVFGWAQDVARRHGQVNLVFNNAGVALAATVAGMEIEDFEWLMNINFWGVVHGTQAFLPQLMAAGEGHVVNISSLFGLMTVPGQSAYHASKFAVRGFTESLRQELDVMQCGVSATCVHPGGIKTAIARNARKHQSLVALGVDPDAGTESFEKNFITTPERAARIILRGVERDARRVLVGPDAALLEKLHRLMPQRTAHLLARALKQTSRKHPAKKAEAGEPS